MSYVSVYYLYICICLCYVVGVMRAMFEHLINHVEPNVYRYTYTYLYLLQRERIKYKHF